MIQICPKHHYCPTGSWEPIPCITSYICPEEGNAKPEGVEFIFFTIVIGTSRRMPPNLILAFVLPC